MLAELRPDVLLLGGDFVSVRSVDIASLAPLLASIHAPLGKFGVLGNHDVRTDWRHVVRELERAEVRILSNECVALDAPFDDVTICGVDDPLCGEPRPDLAIDGVDGTRVVLMHSPETLPAIGDRAFDLALCGHTHGGQIATPWGTPLFVPGGPLNRRFCRGEFALDGPEPRTLLVTSGVGCSAVPARLFAAPEVHLCLIT
jgi:predicted MPP superfamily phosphohydrolase